MDQFLCITLAVAPVWATVGYFAGRAKGNETSGIVWGLLLGPLGVLVTALLPDRRSQGGYDSSGGYDAPPLTEFEERQLAEIGRAEAAARAKAAARKEEEMRAKVVAEEANLRARIEREERASLERIEREERIRAEVRAKLDAERRGKE